MYSKNKRIAADAISINEYRIINFINNSLSLLTIASSNIILIICGIPKFNIELITRIKNAIPNIL